MAGSGLVLLCDTRQSNEPENSRMWPECARERPIFALAHDTHISQHSLEIDRNHADSPRT